MSVKGSSERSDCAYTSVVLNEVPDFGDHVRIDHGPMHVDCGPDKHDMDDTFD